MDNDNNSQGPLFSAFQNQYDLFGPTSLRMLVEKSSVLVKNKGVNKYVVMDESNSVLYTVKQKGPCHSCCTCCCARNLEDDDEEMACSSVNFYLLDTNNQEVVRAKRSEECKSCSNIKTLEVYLSPNNHIGNITNDGSWRRYALSNPSGDRLYSVEHVYKCCRNPDYQ
ncbi:hypothetical protein SK128_004205, partial [Halocaridina rubra]